MEDLVEKIKKSIQRERLCEDVKELQWRSLDLNLDNCLNRAYFFSKEIGKRYLVYLTRKINFDLEKPEQIELASMGVVYNMRYIFHLLEAKRKRLRITYGLGYGLFTYEKSDVNIECLCIESSNLPININNTLLPEEVLKIAKYMGRFQVNANRWIGDASKRCIIFNNGYLLTFLNDQLINYQPTYIESLEKYMSIYFKNPSKMMEQVKYYLKPYTTFDKLENKKFNKLLPTVISHSFLCPEVITFNHERDEVEIKNWHYVTYMPAGNLHKLLTMLSGDELSMEEKKVLAQRWEAAIDEAYFNDYYDL
uniref:HNH endonuclease n=1 Tax=Parastrongyloides trichosuri TaxID=131310 RepID=A0A0N5A4K6_PARTI